MRYEIRIGGCEGCKKICGVIVTDTDSGAYWGGGPRVMHIDITKKDAFNLLHEVGHVIIGYGCCREHCEYLAQGVAVGLSKAYDIKYTQKDVDFVGIYSEYTKEGNCEFSQKRKEGS